MVYTVLLEYIFCAWLLENEFIVGGHRNRCYDVIFKNRAAIHIDTF